MSLYHKVHKVPTPLIHNFGITVYQIEKQKNSSIFQKNWCMNENIASKVNNSVEKFMML